MSNELTKKPIDWQVTGNIIPDELVDLVDTTPFTSSNSTLTVLTAQTVDGHSLRRLKIQPSW